MIYYTINRKYEFGSGLLRYCQNDYQGYGGAHVYVRQKRRLGESSNRRSTPNVQNKVLLTLDIHSKQYGYETLEDYEEDTMMGYADFFHGDFDNLESAVTAGVDVIHHVKIYFDNGRSKDLYYREKKRFITVPPLDLFNETIRDKVPSVIELEKTELKIVVDEMNENIRNVETENIVLR